MPYYERRPAVETVPGFVVPKFKEHVSQWKISLCRVGSYGFGKFGQKRSQLKSMAKHQCQGCCFDAATGNACPKLVDIRLSKKRRTNQSAEAFCERREKNGSVVLRTENCGMSMSVSVVTH